MRESLSWRSLYSAGGDPADVTAKAAPLVPDVIRSWIASRRKRHSTAEEATRFCSGYLSARPLLLVTSQQRSGHAGDAHRQDFGKVVTAASPGLLLTQSGTSVRRRLESHVGQTAHHGTDLSTPGAKNGRRPAARATTAAHPDPPFGRSTDGRADDHVAVPDGGSGRGERRVVG